MKRIIFSGLALAFIMSGGTTSAQNNAGSYTDDVYYNASKASDVAGQQADEQDDTDAAYYDSSAGQNYQDSDYADENDNQYIDYSDDDYSSRIRRFYYPMAGAGYWGGVYNPFWMNSYYPSYGWGSGWYSPGFSMSFGWNPFWGNSWYGGYGYAYSPFYNPYYGYGWGAGYWNGYNDGWQNNGYAGRYNYRPRGLRQSTGVRGIGNYGRNSRTTPLTRSSNTVRPERASVTTNRLSGMENVRNRQVVNNDVHLGNTRVYNNNMSGNGNRPVVEMNRDNTRANTEVQTSRKSFRFSPRNNNSRSVSSDRETYRSYSPPARSSEPSSRSSYTPEPSRSYSAPSRSYSAPSRGSSGGGSSRSMRR